MATTQPHRIIKIARQHLASSEYELFDDAQDLAVVVRKEDTEYFIVVRHCRRSGMLSVLVEVPLQICPMQLDIMIRAANSMNQKLDLVHIEVATGIRFARVRGSIVPSSPKIVRALLSAAVDAALRCRAVLLGFAAV